MEDDEAKEEATGGWRRGQVDEEGDIGLAVAMGSS